jgi:putative DNA primase/helicase
MTVPLDEPESPRIGATIVAFPRGTRPLPAPAEPRSGEDEPSSQTGGSRPSGDDKPPGAHDGGRGRGRRGGGDSDDGDDAADLNRRLALLPLTDLGNAERFAARNEGRFLYCPALGWLWWDGRRWSRVGAEEAVKRAEHETIRAIQDEAKALRDSEQDVELKEEVKRLKDGAVMTPAIWLSDLVARHGRASESAQRLGSVSKRAAAMLAIDVADLDADPWRINVLNGTLVVKKTIIELADGHPVERPVDADYITLVPHAPEHRITKLAPVIFDPAADYPLFKAFLDRVQPPDSKGERRMQKFLAQWAGYALTGSIAEQKMTFHYGKGRNGKGVWVNALSHVAGDYADAIPIESFMDSGRARAGGQATPDIAGVVGVRFLTTSEPKKNAVLDDAFIKLFTGGDKIKARFLNRDYFGFVPVAKLTMQGNYRPKAPTDEGLWSRLLLVPWGVFIPPEERDQQLGDKLRAEASGILNWMLDGLRSWLDEGLKLPDEVSKATEDYRSDSDPLGRFLGVCTMQDIGHRVQASDMHALFIAWAKANGESEWSMKGLAAALKERGIASIKSSSTFWLDLKLTKHVHDFVDYEGKPIRMRDESDGASFEELP